MPVTLTADELQNLLRELTGLMGPPQSANRRAALDLCLRRLAGALEDEGLYVRAEAFAVLNADGRRLALVGLMAMLTMANLDPGER